jgi:hypothetical protein
MGTDPQYPALLTVIARSEPVVILPIAAPPPRLLSSRDSNNIMRLRTDGTLAQTYNLEASESLDAPDWHVIGSLMAGTNAPSEFRDQIDPHAHSRFYRLVKP